MFIILGLIIIMIFFIFLVLYIIGRWKLYQKAGKNGWEAIIPFYNDWIYVEISGLNWWWFLLVMATTISSLYDSLYSDDIFISLITSLISLFALFVCNYNISKKLHKDTAFAILMTIFPFILIPMIGLSDSYKFDNNVPVSNNGPFDNSNTVNNMTTNSYENKETNNNSNLKYCSHCGSQVNINDKYCKHCGNEIK